MSIVTILSPLALEVAIGIGVSCIGCFALDDTSVRTITHLLPCVEFDE